MKNNNDQTENKQKFNIYLVVNKMRNDYIFQISITIELTKKACDEVTFLYYSNMNI